MNALLLLCLLALGIFLLIQSSGYLVESLSAIAKRWRVSKFVVSFLLLSLATSLPELSVGINAAIAAESVLSLGDVFGTNIVNIALILGLVAFIGGGITLKDTRSVKQIHPMTLAIVAAPFLLLIDGTLSRVDGIILLGLFVLRMGVFAKDNGLVDAHHSALPHSKRRLSAKSANSKTTAAYMWRFAASALVLVGSAYIVVSSVIGLSELLGVSSFLIGLFAVAVGTSLPELMVGLRSIQSRAMSISVGNIFGAVTINSSLVLGVVAVLHPIQIDSFDQYAVAAIVTVLSMSLVYWLLTVKRGITRTQGLLLVVVYIIFIAVQAQLGLSI